MLDAPGSHTHQVKGSLELHPSHLGARLESPIITPSSSRTIPISLFLPTVMGSVSSPIYEKLSLKDESEPLVEGNNSNEDLVHLDHGGKFISLNRFLVLQIGILVIFTLFTVAIKTTMFVWEEHTNPSSDMLVPYLKTKEFTYTQSPELSNMSHDFDQDFLRATSPMHGEGMAWLSFNDTSRRNWGVAMFHALHCLRFLRTKLQSSGGNVSTDVIPGHTGHCFDYIVQVRLPIRICNHHVSGLD
jgi:hypothetical protein